MTEDRVSSERCVTYHTGHLTIDLYRGAPDLIRHWDEAILAGSRRT